jgi:hypothetical protein
VSWRPKRANVSYNPTPPEGGWQPLNEAELDEVRRITPSTEMFSVSLGTPYVVVARLVATIDALDRRLEGAEMDLLEDPPET